MYLVPRNVGTRFEFAEGFGFKELFYCVLAAAAGYLISVFLGFFITAIWKYLPLPLLVSVTFIYVRIDPRTGTSLLANILTFRSFASKTNRYDYVYGEGRKQP